MSLYTPISRLGWAAAQSITVVPATVPQLITGVMNFGVTIRLSASNTGTLAGSFALQVTDFGTDEKDLQPLPTDWVTITGSSQTWASAPLVYSVANQGNKWLRVFFINSSSTGTPLVDIAFTGKAWT